MTPFVLQPQSVHHEILERLCAMAKPVRGIAEAMLNRSYNMTGCSNTLCGKFK